MKRRSVYMVAGIDAIDYAEIAIASLFVNCSDSITFTLITDSASDRDRYAALLDRLPGETPWVTRSQGECDALAEEVFRNVPHVRAFRLGHPCWRKITDPSLFAVPGSEVIVLDPDLYFPNAFHFEATPKGRLLLMRQRRHCLLPADVVRAAFQTGLPIAHHTDIGVAQHDELPWPWIDSLIAQLGGTDLPRVAHVESILWAMIAMKIGGGYLSPRAWACWERTLGKRLLMLLGFSGPGMLRLERTSRLKCFHASSGAKEWLVAAHEAGIFHAGEPRLAPVDPEPFVAIGRAEYEAGERMKGRYHAMMRGLRVRDPFQGPAGKLSDS